MARKKRHIRADLAREGFSNCGGKGDHTVWVHPLMPGPGHVSVDSKDGDDAKPYDECNLRRALHDLEEARKRLNSSKGTRHEQPVFD